MGEPHTAVDRLDAPTLANACRCSVPHAQRWLGPIASACRAFAINTPQRLAAFLAQIGHESGGLRYTEEIWGPTPAQTRYEGRKDLGNTEPGDGQRYRGRGLIQITGRYNYRACREGLRDDGIDCPDFEATPEDLASPEWAAITAAWYWDSHRLNVLADTGTAADFELITRRINGGLNGQADRLLRWDLATAAMLLLPAAMADATTAPTSAPSPPPHPAPQPAPDRSAGVDLASPPAQPGGHVNGQGEWISDAPATAHASAPTPFETFADFVAGDTSPQPSQEQPMAPFIAAALPALIDLVPKLGSLFASGSATAQRNVRAAQIVVDAAKAAVGATNEQEMVERITTDKTAADKARQAVEGVWFQIQEVGGGVDAARKADLAAMQAGAGAPFWKSSPSFWVAIGLLPLVYMIVGNVVGLLGIPLSDEVRSAIANGVVGLVLGGLIGYYYGQSTSRNRGST